MENEKALAVQDENKNLPLIADLYGVEKTDQLFKTDQLNLLLNQEPNPKWVLENKFANNSKYIPIGILETLLQRIFKEFKVEVLREGTMFNAVYITVRLHYLHPITGEWSFHDGVGSCQIQTRQGASPADLQSINNNAVMMALPMAKSYAIKDATDHLGKLFGRDLNRKETLGFSVDKNLDIEADYNEMSKLFEERKDKVKSSDFAEISNACNTSFDKTKAKQYRRFLTHLQNIKL